MGDHGSIILLIKTIQTARHIVKPDQFVIGKVLSALDAVHTRLMEELIKEFNGILTDGLLADGADLPAVFAVELHVSPKSQ